MLVLIHVPSSATNTQWLSSAAGFRNQIQIQFITDAQTLMKDAYVSHEQACSSMLPSFPWPASAGHSAERLLGFTPTWHSFDSCIMQSPVYKVALQGFSKWKSCESNVWVKKIVSTVLIKQVLLVFSLVLEKQILSTDLVYLIPTCLLPLNLLDITNQTQK